MKISPGKISTWVASQNENGNLRLLVIAMLTWLVCFIKPIVGKTYTSWDTHDIGFVNFLYFSDSLSNGIFPLWNHFIQSGTFFPNFNNTGLFSPFQLLFVALSWVISPVYAYELMIQAAVLIGGIGSYLLFRSFTCDRLIALFGATAFAVAVLVPIVGQIGILVSLSSFPWIICVCMKIINNRVGGALHYVILGTLGALYLVSGYMWMDLIHLMIGVIFSLGMSIKIYIRTKGQEKKAAVSIIVNMFLFFGTIALIYGCMKFPGYLSLQFNYGLFDGDYQGTEPRLRSLRATVQFFSYSSIYSVLVAAIDPRILINNGPWMADLQKWSWGAGWVLWIVFLVTPRKKPFGQQAFWLMFMIVALMYSAGNSNFVGDWVKKIPIINANRWWFIGIFYVIIGLIFMIVAKMSSLKDIPEGSKKHSFRLMLVGASSLLLLAYFKSPVYEFAMVTTSLVLVWLLGSGNHANWANLLTALIVLNVLSIASMPYSGISWPARYLLVTDNGGYERKVISREKQVAITQNFRRLGEGHDYIYSDQHWLLKKIPFSHGYNNLGNPIYWHVKNEPYLERLVIVTQNVRQEMKMERKNFNSDNAFAETMMGDVLADMSRPTIEATHFRDLLQGPDFKWQLNELKVEPNTASMRVTTDASSFLIFNNVDHPGWNVYVNGKKAELVRTNRVFQGVFLEGAGSFDVVFKFRPVLTIALILSPYLVLFLCLIAYMQKARNRSKLRAY